MFKKVPKHVEDRAKRMLDEIEHFRALYVREEHDFERNLESGRRVGTLATVFRNAKTALRHMAAFIHQHRAFAALVFTALVLGTDNRAASAALEAVRHVERKLPLDMTPREFWNAYWPWAAKIVPPPPPPSQPKAGETFASFVQHATKYFLGPVVRAHVWASRMLLKAGFVTTVALFNSVSCFVLDMTIVAWFKVLGGNPESAWYRNAMATAQTARCHGGHGGHAIYHA